MSASKYSKIPWTIGNQGTEIHAEGDLIAAVRFMGGTNALGKGNADRIVACVHACEKIKDPELSLSKVRELLTNNISDLTMSGMYGAAADLRKCLKLLGGF